MAVLLQDPLALRTTLARSKVLELLAGLFLFCPAYKLFGFNTCPTR